MWSIRNPDKRMFLDWRGYLAAIGLVALATLLKYFAQPDIISAPNSLLYILAIVITAVYFKLGPAIFASILSVPVYDFFFVPPLYSFTFPGMQESTTLVIFLLVGVIVSILASNIHYKTQEAIKADEELQLRAAILDKATDAIFLRDLDNTILYVNDVAPDMYGYNKNEMIGMNLRSFIPPQEIPNYTKRLREVMEKGEMNSEGYHLRKDGSIIPVEVHSHRINIGSREYILSAVRDITRRKQAQQRIQESEEQYRLLVENASEAVIVAQDGVLKFFNPQAMEMTGYSREELSDKPFADVIHPDDQELIAERYKARIKGESVPSKYDIRILHKNGAIKWLELNVVLITWKGRPATLSLLTDITERKRMEQDLKAYAQKITRVQEEERKRIAYELHDDTAQYLSILKLQIESLLQSKKIQDPEILEKLQFLEKDANRAFQDVRRYSHELRPGVLEHLGLQAALEQIADDINKLKQITVEMTAVGEEPVLSEEVKLGFFRIAQEALNNSRKHASASKAIIRLEFQENRIRMKVYDNGTGFDMQEVLNRTSLKGNLGLMSMQERAKLIGAHLNLDSKPGQGTTVSLEMDMGKM